MKSALFLLGAALAACGADYYDKAPPMPPPGAPSRAVDAGGPARPTFTLGPGAPADVESAAQSLFASCGNGDAAACNQVGLLAASNTWGTRNSGQAAKLFEEGCTLGSAAACENLAEAFDHGDGVRADAQKAWELRERACRGKRGYACMTLGVRYAVGQGNAPRDFARARDYLTRACEDGDPDACQLAGVVASCQAHTDRESCASLDAMKARLDGAAGAPDAGR